LEWTGRGSDFTVHALATIAGDGHRVHLFTSEPRPAPAVPILLGYGMPGNAEMASPIKPAAARNVHLTNDLPRVPVIRGSEAIDCTVDGSNFAVFGDDVIARLPQRSPSPPSTQTHPAPSR
jgi:hypothetical protein